MIKVGSNRLEEKRSFISCSSEADAVSVDQQRSWTEEKIERQGEQSQSKLEK